MAKRIQLWDRMKWVNSLKLPDRTALLLMIFVQEASATGEVKLFPRKATRDTKFEPRDLVGALHYFVDLGLLELLAVQHHDDDEDVYSCNLVHGAKVTEQQLTIDQHGMVWLIEQIPDIEDRHQVALEKLVMRHFDWASGQIVITTEEQHRISPRWKRTKTYRIIEELVSLGFLTRSEGVRHGYGASPHIYRLEIRTKRPDLGTIPVLKSPDSRTIPALKSPDPGTIPALKSPDPGTISTENVPNSVTSEAPILITETSHRTPLPEPPLRTPPPPQGGVGAERSKSSFWERLLLLDRHAARNLTRIAKLEARLGAPWHESQADQVVDDLDLLRANPMISDEYGALISRYEDMASVWDFTAPADVERRLTPDEAEAAERDRREEVEAWEKDRQHWREQYSSAQVGDAGQLWAATLGQLQAQVTKPNFDTWLKHTSGLSWTDDEFVVGCPNAFVAEMIEQRMYSLVAQTLESVVASVVEGSTEDVEVEVRFAVESTWSPVVESERANDER